MPPYKFEMTPRGWETLREVLDGFYRPTFNIKVEYKYRIHRKFFDISKKKVEVYYFQSFSEACEVVTAMVKDQKDPSLCCETMKFEVMVPHVISKDLNLYTIDPNGSIWRVLALWKTEITTTETTY